MRHIAILLATLLCIIGCSGSPPSLTEMYEGVWVDESVPLTLSIEYVSGATFVYELSSGPWQLLSGTLYSYPDGSVTVYYDDGEQRQITLLGTIHKGILSAEYTNTGHGFDREPVSMRK